MRDPPPAGEAEDGGATSTPSPGEHHQPAGEAEDGGATSMPSAGEQA